ncbi:hypothetical protein H1C71_035480, partial [Ictidomys tridecemlineatus]
ASVLRPRPRLAGVRNSLDGIRAPGSHNNTGFCPFCREKELRPSEDWLSALGWSLGGRWRLQLYQGEHEGSLCSSTKYMGNSGPYFALRIKGWRCVCVGIK